MQGELIFFQKIARKKSELLFEVGDVLEIKDDFKEKVDQRWSGSRIREITEKENIFYPNESWDLVYFKQFCFYLSSLLESQKSTEKYTSLFFRRRLSGAWKLDRRRRLLRRRSRRPAAPLLNAKTM